MWHLKVLLPRFADKVNLSQDLILSATNSFVSKMTNLAITPFLTSVYIMIFAQTRTSLVRLRLCVVDRWMKQFALVCFKYN